MINTRSRYITYIILFFLLLSFSWAEKPPILSESTVTSFMNKRKQYDTASDSNSILSNNPKNTKELIVSFCNTVLDSKTGKSQFYENENQSSKVYFDARQSVFIYVLCAPFEDNTKDIFPYFTGSNNILKKQNRSDYEIQCNTESNLNSCKLHNSIHKIIIEILNDIGNIKTASAYGLVSFDFSSDFKKQLTDMANNFGGIYFNENLTLCDAETCIYPKTLSHLKKFLRNANTLAKKNTTFDVETLTKLQKQTNSCLQTLIGGDGYNNYVCGLLGNTMENTNNQDRTNIASLYDFTNLVYNELRRYNLFTTYYAYILRKDTQLLPYTMTSNPTTLTNKTQKYADNMLQNSKIVETTTQQMIQQISHIQFKFPIHIGLMMYYERLYDLRMSMLKIYTPLHQLYYKLRNVQQAK